MKEYVFSGQILHGPEMRQIQRSNKCDSWDVTRLPRSITVLCMHTSSLTGKFQLCSMQYLFNHAAKRKDQFELLSLDL